MAYHQLKPRLFSTFQWLTILGILTTNLVASIVFAFSTFETQTHTLQVKADVERQFQEFRAENTARLDRMERLLMELVKRR